jgi:hypothetical protein
MVRDPDFVKQAVQLADDGVDLLGQVARIHRAGYCDEARDGSSRRSVAQGCRDVEYTCTGSSLEVCRYQPVEMMSLSGRVIECDDVRVADLRLFTEHFVGRS